MKSSVMLPSSISATRVSAMSTLMTKVLLAMRLAEELGNVAARLDSRRVLARRASVAQRSADRGDLPGPSAHIALYRTDAKDRGTG
jgi:hypothetical protein